MALHSNNNLKTTLNKSRTYLHMTLNTKFYTASSAFLILILILSNQVPLSDSTRAFPGSPHLAQLPSSSGLKLFNEEFSYSLSVFTTHSSRTQESSLCT